MEKMIERMTGKVVEVNEAVNAVHEFLDEIEETKAQHGQALVELQEQLSAYEESFATADNLAKAKQFKTFVEETKEEIELIEQVTKAKVFSMYAELSDKAVEAFSTYAEAVKEFKALDKVMVANTGLGQLEANLQLMKGFANSLNGAFRTVRNILLDTGIVPQAEQNQRFRGQVHLGKRDELSELVTFDNNVRPYIYNLKQAGVL